MKKTNLAIIGLFIVLLVACNPSSEDGLTSGGGQESSGSSPIFDEEIKAVLEDLAPRPHLVNNSGWDTNQTPWEWVNKISLIDLTTGNILASYEFESHIQLSHPTGLALGNGYYAVGAWVVDPITFEYLEREVMIFNDSLEVIDTVFYDIDVVSPLHWGFLQFREGELIAYTLEIQDEVSSGELNPVAFNLHTGEIEILADIDENIGMMQKFIGDNQIFVIGQIEFWDRGSITTRYGIVDLETETVQLFEKEYFSFGTLDFNGSQVLIGESHSVGPAVLNEVVVFNVENMSSQTILLEGEEESHWVRFSYDGNHIVTVNEGLSLFRKYDLNGELVAEMEIEIPSTLPQAEEFMDDPQARVVNSFEVFPLTSEVYVIFTTVSFIVSGMFLFEYHHQLVVLP